MKDILAGIILFVVVALIVCHIDVPLKEYKEKPNIKQPEQVLDKQGLKCADTSSTDKSDIKIETNPPLTGGEKGGKINDIAS